MRTIFVVLMILPCLLAYAVQSPILLQVSLSRAYHDCANHVLLTDDGSYLVTGWAISRNRSYDGYAVKLSRDGGLVFEKLFGSKLEDEFNVSLQVNGYYFLGGTTFSMENDYDAWVVKLDRNGQKVLEKVFGGSKRDEILAGIVCSDGSLMFVGRTSSYGKGETDVYVLKVDQELNLIWQRTFGGPSLDEAYAVMELEDGYLVVGFSESFSLDEDTYVLKIDPNGKKVFEKVYEHPFLQKAVDVTQVEDGFVLVGFSWNEKTDDSDGLMVKTDLSGNLLWMKMVGTKGWEQFNRVLKNNKTLLLTGVSRNDLTNNDDVYVVRVDRQGNVLSEFYSKIENAEGCKHAAMLNGELIVVGWIDNSDLLKWDILLLKIDLSD